MYVFFSWLILIGLNKLRSWRGLACCSGCLGCSEPYGSVSIRDNEGLPFEAGKFPIFTSMYLFSWLCFLISVACLFVLLPCLGVGSPVYPSGRRGPAGLLCYLVSISCDACKYTLVSQLQFAVYYVSSACSESEQS